MQSKNNNVNECLKCGNSLVAKGSFLIHPVTGERKEITHYYCPDCHSGNSKPKHNILGIPDRFIHADFQSFNPSLCPEYEENFRKVIKYTEKPTKGLVLLGEPGLGKTHLAISVTKYLAEKFKVAGRFIDVVKTVTEYKQNGFSGQMFKLRKITVLDDLDKLKQTDWIQESVYGLVNDLYNKDGHVFIITCNQPLDRYLDSYTVGRLAEVSTIIRFTGQDYRMRGNIQDGVVSSENQALSGLKRAISNNGKG